MDCKWIPFGDKYRCEVCGFVVPNNTFHKNCGSVQRKVVAGKDKEIPNLLQRGVNLGKAVVKHAQGGFQHCTEEQKKARFAICQSNRCELFKVHGEGGICSHDDCGCYIRSNGKFMDKLSWAESKCPKEMWGPIEQKIPQSE
jgi:hypothetical protein